MYNKVATVDDGKGPQHFIKDLYPQAKNLQMKVIVLHVGNSYKTKDGNEVRSCKVADKTGCVNLSIWGDYGNYVQPSDILSLSRCYAVLFKNSLTLYVGKFGSLMKVGEFCMTFSEAPDVSEPNPEWIQQSQDNKTAASQASGNSATTSYHSGNSKSSVNKQLQFRSK